MITNVPELYGAMQGLVSTITGINQASVILADQGAPAPSGLYATYNPIPVRAWGHSRSDRKLVAATEDFNESLLGTGWEDFEETTVTQMEFLLSVNALNDGARSAIMRLHNANFRWPVQECLYANGIAYREASEVRNLTALDRADFQPRWQADARLWLETSITDTVLRANDFDLIIEDGDGNVLYQET